MTCVARATGVRTLSRIEWRGLDRGAELTHISTPTLVIEAPEGPINPPPRAEHIARSIPGS